MLSHPVSSKAMTYQARCCHIQ